MQDFSTTSIYDNVTTTYPPMPQSDDSTVQNPESVGLGLSQLPNSCPNPLTPPPEQHDHYAPVRLQSGRQLRTGGTPSADNTAAGMAQSQEDSIYLSPAASPETVVDVYRPDDDIDNMDVALDDYKDGTKTSITVNTYQTDSSASSISLSAYCASPMVSYPADLSFHSTNRTTPSEQIGTANTFECADIMITQSVSDNTSVDNKDEADVSGLAPVDLLFNRTTNTKPWSFSERRMLPDYPSHVLQPFSFYSGTQESDRQVYNVDVTILTVDIAQCTMTGYLLIRGLTPEHDTLQTYFTGEIIGGPPRTRGMDQHYTFRTANPAWGATEKTDLTHWARFPAWRSLSSYAKRDINFTYPIDGGNWWQQDNIFMRWKEHFLVPDHKTRSIAGASFEGFYYICLNQVQGEISGIYYHSKSEKFQQLKLKHEGQPDIFNRGVAPSIEFR